MESKLTLLALASILSFTVATDVATTAPFVSQVYVPQISNPRQLLLDLAGTNHDNGTSTVETTTIIDGAGLSLTHGIALSNGFLYASSALTVYRWPYKPGQFSIINQNTRQTVITNITQVSTGHRTRTLTFDAEGRLYISVGSYANIDADSYRSRIRRFNVDMQFLPIPFNNGEIFADGCRNTVGLAWSNSGILYGVDNGEDMFTTNVTKIVLRRLRSLKIIARSCSARTTENNLTSPPTSAKKMADEESVVRRNPHGDFKSIDASRPPFDKSAQFHFTQTHSPNWKPGDGSNDNGECLQKEHIAIDPHEDGRPSVFNYKLLISAIVPRPIGFISTRSADGNSTNIAPFSYFQTICHDPPMFVVSFSGGLDKAKDTLRNLVETKECVINIVSEHFIEAANATSTNAPYGVSEWVLSGLTPAECRCVKSPRVKEAVFSIEGILVETKKIDSKAAPVKKSDVLAIIEGVQFWVREDAINEEKNLIDLKVLRPVSRFDGIMYGRTTQPFEIPRPDYSKLIDEFGDDLKLYKIKYKERLSTPGVRIFA